MQDRPRIQAAIMKGDAKALYELASEYKKQGLQHAANELFQKAKWLGSYGELADQVTSLQNKVGPTNSEPSMGATKERPGNPTD